MDIKTILWATDGSPEAELALEYSKYLAGLADASILGVHVIPLPVGLLFEALREHDPSFEKWQSGVERKVTDKFDEVKSELAASGIGFEGIMLRGKPGEEISAFALKRGVDLVVMGKRGHGLLERMMVGSETSKVLKSSHVPVLAAKRKKDHEGPVKIHKILVPVDLSDDNETAFIYALDLASMTGASVTVVYAIRLDMYAQDMPAGALDIVIKQSIKELADRVTDMSDDYGKLRGCKMEKPVSSEVIHGLSPALTIASYAAENEIDLIAINTHGRTGIEKLVLGSVTERLIPESPCSVLALRP